MSLNFNCNFYLHIQTAKIDKPCEKVDKAYAKLYKPCEKVDKAYAKIDKTCAPVK